MLQRLDRGLRKLERVEITTERAARLAEYWRERRGGFNIDKFATATRLLANAFLGREFTKVDVVWNKVIAEHLQQDWRPKVECNVRVYESLASCARAWL